MDVLRAVDRKRPARGVTRSPATTRVIVNWICVATACALSLLVFTAFQPHVPQPELDESWRYGVDMASAQHLSFGRAVVFTFGPLGSLYSDFYVPAHDTFYLSLKIFVTLGIVSAFMSAASRSRQSFLLLLPIFLANLLVEDAVFFVLPVALLVACDRRHVPPLLWRGSIGIAAVTVGLLPLIKGTMSIPGTHPASTAGQVCRVSSVPRSACAPRQAA